MEGQRRHSEADVRVYRDLDLSCRYNDIEIWRCEVMKAL